MKWQLPALVQAHPRRESSSHICAWCDRRIGPHRGRLHGEPAVKYGLCPSCLEHELSRLARWSAHGDEVNSTHFDSAPF